MPEERETEVVQGVIGGITQKKADTWTVAVRPDGSQYDKALWTKSTTLVEALSAKLGQHGAFVCNASYWTMNDGKQVRSLWIESEADGTENVPERVATPAAAPKAGNYATGGNPASGDGMSKDDWGRKDSAIHMMAAIKAAADALKHTIPSDPTPEDLTRFLERCKTLSYNWWQRADAVRKGDDSDVPFLSESDDSIPY
jgi:hypothetical protein